MADNTKLTPQQRAELFGVSTRQNFQMLASQTANAGATSLQFNLPKARLLSGLTVNVTAKVDITHPTATSVPSDIFTAYRLLRNISLDLNNGFKPFTLSGEEIAMYNMISIHPNIVAPQSENAQGYTYLPKLKAGATGVENEFSFTVTLPCTLNKKDPVGFILLQNNETNVTLTADICNGSELLNNADGYTVNIKNVTVKVMVESFSLPVSQNAYPDLSVLKLVNGRVESMPSNGQQVIKLSTGTIYRKLIFKIEDELGNTIVDDDILSNIELLFNQADCNYSVDARMLRIENERMLGYALPKGMFVFDFSNAGSFVDMGGSRDLIDTSQLTEFWLRFTTKNKGKVKIVSECISRLV